MQKEEKTKEQLIDELIELKRENAQLKSNEIALETSEERYRNFVEKTEELLTEYDFHGRCIYCNEASLKHSGYSRDEFMQMNMSNRFSCAEESDRILAIFKRVYRTGKSENTVINNIICKGGEKKSLETSISLVLDNEGKPAGFRCISRDVTIRKRLEAQQERYRNFVDNIEDGCFEFDLNGKIMFCNDALPGYSAILTKNLNR